MIDDHVQNRASGWIAKAQQSPLALILIAAIAALVVIGDGTTESISEKQGVVTATEAADGVVPSLAPQDENDAQTPELSPAQNVDGAP
jgi:archaellin